MKLAELRAGPEPDRPRARWPRWLVASLLLLALALGAVVFVVISRDRPAAPQATVLPSTPEPPAAAVPPPPATDLDLNIPTTTPADLSWSTYAGEWEPTSPTAGPMRVAGAVASGYARTPLGALIAAQQIGSRYVIAPRGGWRDVVLTQVVPGPKRARYLLDRAKTSDDAPPAGWGQPVGFRYVTWTPDQGVIQLLAHIPGRSDYQGFTTTVVWRDGDWQLLLDTALPPAFTAPTPTGFVLWGAPRA